MTVDELRKFVNFLAKKNQSGANPSPSEFNLAMQRAYVEFTTDRYKAWQANQKNTDDIKFLLVEKLFQVPVTGQITIPNGTTVTDVTATICPKYMHISSLKGVYVENCNGVYEQKETNVDILRDNEVSYRLTSKIIPPTKDEPVATVNNTYIQFYPKTIGFAKMSYLKTPTVPVWGFTLNASGVPTYDVTTSTQIETPDDSHNDLAMRILRYLGISIREIPLVQYANAMKEEGI